MHISNFQTLCIELYLGQFFNCSRLNANGIRAVRQQAIIWTNVNSELFRHMAQPGHIRHQDSHNMLYVFYLSSMIAVSSADQRTIVDLHNKFRGEASPSAAYMMKLVSLMTCATLSNPVTPTMG